MWFSVCMVFATGGGGGGGVAAPLAVLTSAFRNVLMRRKRTTTDFFINPPFASGAARNLAKIIATRTDVCRSWSNRLDKRFVEFVFPRCQFGNEPFSTAFIFHLLCFLEACLHFFDRQGKVSLCLCDCSLSAQTSRHQRGIGR